MTEAEFQKRFTNAVNEAIKLAESTLKIKLPIDFRILLYAPHQIVSLVPLEVAMDVLYLGEDLNFRAIDVAAMESSRGVLTIFVRPTNHKPGTMFWDEPTGTGPFKVMVFTDRSKYQ